MITTGIKLQDQLGLSEFRYVYIARALITTYKVYYIFYDSKNPKFPITNHRAIEGYMPSYLIAHPFKHRPQVTPLRFLTEFNGNMTTSLFFVIDMAGRYANPRELTHYIEHTNKALKPIFFGKLKEFVTIPDLMHKDNISSITMKFRKDRTKELGGENTVAKIIDVFLEEGSDSVTFVFATPATPYPNEVDHKYQQTDFNTFELTSLRNNNRYIIHIKFLEFFSWLKTHPNITEINRNDIREIINVANVQLWSNSPSWHWQGFNWWNSQLDGSIYPTDIKPKRWDKIHGDGQAFLDKHTYGLLRQMKFFEIPMAQILTKKLKDQGYLE